MGKKIISKNFVDDYNPYINIDLSSKFFEDDFIEYLNKFKDVLADDDFVKKIILENDRKLSTIINDYLVSDGVNANKIKEFMIEVRKIKDIILLSEPALVTKRHIREVDKQVNKAIDDKNKKFNIYAEDENYLKELFLQFSPNIDSYDEDILAFKSKIKERIEYYRIIFPHEKASKKIRQIIKKSDALIDEMIKNLDIEKSIEIEFFELLLRHIGMDINDSSSYDAWVSSLRNDFENIKNEITDKCSISGAKKLIQTFSTWLDEFIQNKADSLDYLKENEDILLNNIFNNFEESILVKLNEQLNSIDNYFYMNESEQQVIKRRMYDEFFRIFKREIRNFNSMIRLRYSSKVASKYVDKVNIKADKFANSLIEKIGLPIPKNPWFIRKYLWADLDNFASEKGIAFRKSINYFLKKIVKLAMKNQLIIEEEQQLDPTQQYVFVSTHYFTEDVIGTFVSIDRQVYMLMGTTDQIENNFLMVAAALLGFFHVDRLDSKDRTLCFEKQNKLIDLSTSFINYVGGSWENSENELQPLSFSGPVRTSKQKGVLIVPRAAYFVKEEKKIYVRTGQPLDLKDLSEDDANEIIRDTLASMHYKQICKHSYPINDIVIKDGDKEFQTHDLPYDQHTYYMDQIGKEYWNQPWTRPFAVEEIGVRKRKITTLEDVYGFIDKLSREKLIELSSIICDPLKRIDEDNRYNVVKYLDNNYERFKKLSRKK